MSAEARKRVRQLRQDPSVKKWIKEFKDVCDRMPECLMVFVGGGNTILVLDEHGRRYNSGDALDEDASIDDFSGRFEGGDF